MKWAANEAVMSPQKVSEPLHLLRDLFVNKNQKQGRIQYQSEMVKVIALNREK